MSTRTLITKAATTLTAVQIPSKTVAAGHFNAADIAAINALIINDQAPTQHVYMSLAQNGLLIVPNRGQLKLLPGDVVFVDGSGGVGFVSGYSIAQGAAWTIT